MSPRPPDLPEEIETARLIVRCARPGDGAAVNAAIRETWEGLQLWMPWAVAIPPVADTEEHMARWRASYLERSEFEYTAWRRADAAFVAMCGLHPTRWDVPSFMIGYWCRKRFEGQGYMSEVVRRVARFAFEDLAAKRVWISCDPENLRSRRVAERCGFTLDGELRNESITPQGEVRNTLIYSMIPVEIGRLNG